MQFAPLLQLHLVAHIFLRIFRAADLLSNSGYLHLKDHHTNQFLYSGKKTFSGLDWL